MSRLCGSALFVLAIMATQNAQAQSVPTVVVTGQGLDMDTDAAGYDSVVVDRDRLTNSASNRLEDVLGDVSGLSSYRRADSRSANPTSQGVTLRGLGGNASSRALVILDGVPQNDPFAGWVAFPLYDPNRLGRVQVVRGGGSGRWGAGALTGTIELNSASPDQIDTMDASFAYGSRNALDSHLSGKLERAGGYATLSAAYARGDGFIPIVAEDRGSIDQAAPYEQASAALRSVVSVGGSTELQANIQGFVDNRQRGTPYTAIKSSGTDASLRLVGKGKWRWSALAYVQFREFSSSFARISDARDAASQVLDQYSVPGTGVGARVEIEPPRIGPLSVRAGGDWRRVSGRTQERYSFVSGVATRERKAGGTTDTKGVFGALSLDQSLWRLDLDGRVDQWTIDPGFLKERSTTDGTLLTDTHYAAREGTQWTGRAAVTFKPTEGLSLRGAAYRGWRLPTLNELYRPFRVGADATAGNAMLDPEVLTGVEAGVRWHPVDGLVIGVTGYRDRLAHAIANITIARGPGVFDGVGFVSAAGVYRQRGNLDAIVARGIEADATFIRGPMSLNLSYTHVDAKVRASGVAAGLNGLRPAQVPADQFSGTLTWAGKGGTRLSATGRYLGKRYEDDQNSQVLAAAFTLDAVARVSLTPQWSIEVRAENLFNARVETGFSGDALERSSPRTLWLGLQFRLK